MWPFWKRNRKKAPKNLGVRFKLPPDRLLDWPDLLAGLDADIESKRVPDPGSPDKGEAIAASVRRGGMEVEVSTHWAPMFGHHCLQIAIRHVEQNLPLARDIDAVFVREGWEPLGASLSAYEPPWLAD